MINISVWSKPEWFVGMTPVNKIPVLQEPNGNVIYESAIIVDYLEDKYRGAQYRCFLPVDPLEKARQKLLLEQIMKIVRKSQNNSHVNCSP